MFKVLHRVFLITCLVYITGCANTDNVKPSPSKNKLESILEHWRNPSENYVFVVAHRAAFMESRQIVRPENSIPAILRAIDLGVDMVELDIRATKDNKFVILHDPTIDRTTNGSGLLTDYTLDEVREFNLINEVNGDITKHKIPTLEEVYSTVKNKIMVNLDPKLPVKDLGRALEMAKEAGVENQIILKGTADTTKQLSDIQGMLSQLPFRADFMPMHWDKSFQDIEQVEQSFSVIKPEAVEMVVNIVNPEEGVANTRRIVNGGVLFSDKIRELAKSNSVHLWINTLYVDPTEFKPSDMHFVMWNGGRHDVLGLKYPDQVFKFWAGRGATIMQTDEPKFLIEYLESNGFRVE